MELEPKIAQVELITDCEKSPLEPTTNKEAKLYLNHIKMDIYRIKYLVNFSQSYMAKRQEDKSASSDLGTDVKHQNQRSFHTSSPEREGKMDKKCSSSKLRESLRSHLRLTVQDLPATRQGCSDQTTAKVNARPDEASADDRQSFAGY